MKTVKDKIDFIYETIARKDLTFGCIVIRNQSKEIFIQKTFPYNRFSNFITLGGIIGNEITYIRDDYKLTDIEKVIGHPLYFGEVAEKLNGDTTYDELYSYWRKMTEPLEKQSDECIDYIYNLIK